jgi:hypothetical protein
LPPVTACSTTCTLRLIDAKRQRVARCGRLSLAKNPRQSIHSSARDISSEAFIRSARAMAPWPTTWALARPAQSCRCNCVKVGAIRGGGTGSRNSGSSSSGGSGGGARTSTPPKTHPYSPRFARRKCMILKMHVRYYRASLPIRFLNAFAAMCRHKLRTAIGIPHVRCGCDNDHRHQDESLAPTNRQRARWCESSIGFGCGRPGKHGQRRMDFSSPKLRGERTCPATASSTRRRRRPDWLQPLAQPRPSQGADFRVVPELSRPFGQPKFPDSLQKSSEIRACSTRSGLPRTHGAFPPRTLVRTGLQVRAVVG